jgi:hypothetical protein
MFTMIGMVLFISSCYGRSMFASNDNSFDVTHNQWSNYGNDISEIVKRHYTEHKCVRCKFGLLECCEPNICVKKFLRPDKCMHIKEGK